MKGSTQGRTICWRCDQPYRLHDPVSEACPTGGTTFRKHVSAGAATSFVAKEVLWLEQVLLTLMAGGRVSVVMLSRPELAGWMRKLRTLKRQLQQKGKLSETAPAATEVPTAPEGE